MFQSTKPEATESTRLLIGFSDVLGLEITEDSIVLDIRPLPKMERMVTCELGRHSATQSSITEVDVNQKSSGKWKGQCIMASAKTTISDYSGTDASKIAKIPQVERAATKNSTLQASTR